MHPRAPIARLSTLLLLAAALSCATACKDKRKPPAIDYIDRGSNAVIHLPRIATVATGLDAAIAAATKGGLEQDVAQIRLAATQALTFDPLTVAGLQEAGIDPEGDMAIALDSRGLQPYAAITLRDPERAARYLKRLFRQQLRAEPIGTVKHKGHDIELLGRVSGDHKIGVGAWTQSGKHLLVALQAIDEDEAAADRIRAAIDRANLEGDNQGSDSIGANLLYKKVLEGFGTRKFGMVVYADDRAPLLSSMDFFRAAAIGIDVDAKGLTASAQAEGSPIQLEFFRNLLGIKSEPPKFEGLLGHRPLFTVKLGLRPKEVLNYIEASASEVGHNFRAQIEEFNQALGVNLETELVPLLTGNMLLSWKLGDITPVVTSRMQNIMQSLAKGQLFRPAFALQVTDAKAADALTARIEKAQLEKEVPLEQVQIGKQKVVRARPPAGNDGKEKELLWTRVGDIIVIAREQAIMQAVLAGNGDTGEPLAKTLFARKDTQMVYIDLPTVTASVKESIASGKGGLTAISLKLIMAKVEKLLANMGGITLGGELKGNTIVLDARLALR